MKIGSVLMVNGFLNPQVGLEVFGPDGEAGSFAATLDTGFSGWVALPESAVNSLSLPYLWTDKITLADASEIDADLHVAQVFFADRVFRVYVVSVGTAPMVGTGLLQNASLTLNMVPDGDITYAPVNA